MSESPGRPWPDNTRRLRLGDLEFDLQSRSVSHDGRVHELGQRCFDLLLLFLREPRQLHARDEIFRRVWGGVVEDANITTSIWQLRKALGESAKGWIRTVAKKGYIFDPPCALEFEAAPAADPVGFEPLVAVCEAPVARARVVAWRPMLRRVGVATVVLFVLLAAFGVLFTSQRQPQDAHVIVMAVPDLSVDDGARWPAELLQSWIQWQLDTRGDRFSVAAGAGERRGAATFVLLSATMPVGRDGDWRLRALLREEARAEAFDRDSTSQGLLTTIDALSRDVLHRLLPEIAKQDFPSLVALDREAAQSLSRAVAAEQRGRWNEAAAAYRRLLDVVPEFGFAHFHLALSLAELGQSNAARSELALAGSWVARLPPSMQPVLHARSLAIRQDYLAAAAEFGTLAQRSVDRSWSLRIAEATNLRRGGDARAALLRLGRELPASSAEALRWLIEKAEAEMAMLQFERARASAEEAVELAHRLGWEHERARAQLLVIDLMNGADSPVEAQRYEDAIAGFEHAGDRIGALRVGIMRQIASGLQARTGIAGLDELLAEARAAGNATAEIDALCRVGLMHLGRGDAQAAQEQLHQAEVIAEAAGDRYLQRQVAASQLRVDSWREDLDAMDKRIRHLRAMGTPGATAFLTSIAQARLEFRRGDYAAMLASAGEAENSVWTDSADDVSANRDEVGVQRLTALMGLGRLVDAKTAAARSTRTGPSLGALLMEASQARLSILSGDRESERPELKSLVEQHWKLRSPVQRWIVIAELAPLLAQVGDIESGRKLVDEAIPAVAGSGFLGIETDLRLASAEIATAQGRVGDARRELERAQQLMQASDWQAQRRAGIVEIVLLRDGGNSAEEIHRLHEVHDQARKHGDVLGELMIHGIAGAELDRLCPAERQARLLASSGMRGASPAWMLSSRADRPHETVLMRPMQGALTR